MLSMSIARRAARGAWIGGVLTIAGALLGGCFYSTGAVTTVETALFDSRQWYELRGSLGGAAAALEEATGADGAAKAAEMRAHMDGLDAAITGTTLANYTQPDNPAAVWKVRAQELHAEGYAIAREAGLTPPLSVTRRRDGVGWYSTWWDFSSP